jgi:hypothetical protein
VRQGGGAGCAPAVWQFVSRPLHQLCTCSLERPTSLSLACFLQCNSVQACGLMHSSSLAHMT